MSTRRTDFTGYPQNIDENTRIGPSPVFGEQIRMTVSGGCGRLGQPTANGDSPSTPFAALGPPTSSGDPEERRHPGYFGSGSRCSRMARARPTTARGVSSHLLVSQRRLARRRQFAPPADTAVLPRSTTTAVTAMAAKPNASSNSSHSPNAKTAGQSGPAATAPEGRCAAAAHCADRRRRIMPGCRSIRRPSGDQRPRSPS